MDLKTLRLPRRRVWLSMLVVVAPLGASAGALLVSTGPDGLGGTQSASVEPWGQPAVLAAVPAAAPGQVAPSPAVRAQGVPDADPSLGRLGALRHQLLSSADAGAALAVLGDPQEDDPRVRALAISSLGRYSDDPRAGETLLGLVESGARDERIQALSVVASLQGGARSLPSLRAHQGDPDPGFAEKLDWTIAHLETRAASEGQANNLGPGRR